MFGTYLYRELSNRRKQTAIIAAGMALAIALVMIVNGVAAGVRDAQSTVLASVYGVGTDITITQEPAQGVEGNDGAPGAEGDQARTQPRFEFGAEDGETTDGTTALSQSSLTSGIASITFDADALTTALSLDSVATATATLALSNVSFSGEVATPTTTDTGETAPGGGAQQGGRGGPDGAGGSAFNVDTFTVTGIDVAGESVGPLTSVELVDGRAFESSDSDANVVILDTSYATTSSLAVGDSLEIGGEEFEVIGTVTSTSADATTASNTYIPLDTAQRVAELENQISTVYVQAASSTDIAAVQTALQTELPDASVKTQEDLASSVSGSLSTASDLVGKLGTWLSIIVLAAAFLISVLLTTSGVARRTREFGTLKAIGWSNGAVVRQVAGESLVQGAIGGVIGVAIGLLGILAINIAAPVLSASATATATTGQGPGAGGGGGGSRFGDAATTAVATTDIALQIPVTFGIIGIAVALAILGGLIAGAFGGWRAARLRPAEALRSVA
ncbi:FtsX-like permease family protein [Salinibacterium sp. UTAS2018]|uniref:ABC transporter permease n=1 Tax=Salinibacterium sp. UTAS2018 TaxID=2508880 RepID=UPI0010096DB7|nr:ABC transporter permease [Salinibacterium sp. UTAS2018]QAV71116.1 FtsX-like permease family protein [Salinibacterium sp. UTAS2018]